MSNYKKNSIGKTIALALCGVLSVAAVAGAGTALYMGAKNNDWFKSDETEIDETNGDETEQDTELASGLVVGDGANRGISLMATKLEVPAEANYESAYEITATVTPDDATDKTINLSLEFSGTEVSWGTASTGDVSDYITLSSSSIESGESVTLYCHQPFGEQIILTGSSINESAASGTCTLDYAATYTCIELDDRASFVTSFDDIFNDGTAESVYDSSVFNSTLCAYVGHGSTYTIVDDIGVIGLAYSYDGTSYTSSYSQSYTYAFEDVEGTEYYTYAQFSFSFDWDILLNNFGLSVNDEEDYETLAALYAAGEAAFTVTVTFTGVNTGTEYSLDADIIFNPGGMYTYASAVSFSDSNLLFY